MKYIAFNTCEVTESEFQALSSYYDAVREFGQYRIPTGSYLGQSCSDHQPMLVEIVDDPLQGSREQWSHLKVVPDPANAIRIIEAAKKDAAFDFSSPAFDQLRRVQQYLTRAIEA